MRPGGAGADARGEPRSQRIRAPRKAAPSPLRCETPFRRDCRRRRSSCWTPRGPSARGPVPKPYWRVRREERVRLRISPALEFTGCFLQGCDSAPFLRYVILLIGGAGIARRIDLRASGRPGFRRSGEEEARDETPGDGSVMTDRWRRAEALFHEMLARPAAERAAALAEQCADDPGLREAVQSLLDRPNPPTGFLDAPAAEIRARLLDAPTHSMLTGRRLGVFELQELLGVGGMGEVYRARDTRLGRDVAIKILSGDFEDHPARLDCLEREARVLASLSHPHIGAIYGLEEADGIKALVLEVVEGEDSRAADCPRPTAAHRGPADRQADCRRTRSRARARHRSPGFEAGKYQDSAGWRGEGPRFRPGQRRQRKPAGPRSRHRPPAAPGTSRVKASCSGRRRT